MNEDFWNWLREQPDRPAPFKIKHLQEWVDKYAEARDLPPMSPTLKPVAEPPRTYLQ